MTLLESVTTLLDECRNGDHPTIDEDRFYILKRAARVIDLANDGPKTSNPDSAINQAHNNQRFIDAVRGMVE